jgi:hypothetical protein
MFWAVMVISCAVLCVTYAAISTWGGRWGMSSYRLRLFRRSSVLLLAWTGISLAHYFRHG